MMAFLVFGVLPLVAILVALSRTFGASSHPVAPTRDEPRSAQPARRPIDQRPFRGSPPRPLDTAPYDIWRQLR